MIAYNITKARKENRSIVHRKELSRISALALEKVSKNYMLYPKLDNLDENTKNKIYDKISVDHPIETTFPLINHDVFWMRSCNKHFKTAECTYHGNSWKQCYAENFMRNLICNYNPEIGKKEDIIKYFDILKFHIFNLELPTFPAGFDLSLIPSYFVNLASLEIKYSPELKEDKKTNFLKKKLTPIKDEYSKFGMRFSDMKKFSIAIGELDYLLNVSLQGNFIDDEMMKWFSTGLITNHTLRYLDLSNNRITEQGMIKLCSFLLRSRTLQSLDLTNNQISGEGGFAISLVIKENTGLKLLKLAMNRFDDQNASLILKALTKNTLLEEIDLSSNELGLITSKALGSCLKLNTTISVIDLSNTNCVFDDDVKTGIKEHPMLKKLDLRFTKCTDEEIKYIDNVLIEKTVKKNLSKS